MEIHFTEAKPGLFKTLFILFLLASTPPFAMILVHCLSEFEGSFLLLGKTIWNEGFLQILSDAVVPYLLGSKTAWLIIGVHASAQLLMMKILPGKKYFGTLSPKGNLPEYKNNGLFSYLISIGLFLFCTERLGWFSAGIVFDHFRELLGALNLLALLFCLLLYFKGRFSPSSSDNSQTGNFLFDYYWGTELYPRILGWDVKMFTNCRFGMTGWALCVISFAFASFARLEFWDWGIVASGSLIVIYLFKFFIWEAGYMRSTDIITDRAGFYICWGCLVWVPAIYTSPIHFMVNHETGISPMLALLIFVLGNIAIWTNYWTDRQRMRVRNTNGETKIWGKAPILIFAKYKTPSGMEQENVLLASGFWGLARHFHYLPEIGAAFFWTVAAGFQFFAAWFYVLFLTILLVHRTFRDEEKCANKYGAYWDAYKKKVKWKIIPGIF